MLTEDFSAHLTDLIGPRSGTAPLAVAFSGGGDSTALLSLVLAWAKGMSVTALIVDHGLRGGSADEAKLAASRARAMGARTEVLTWQGGKPSTGIQKKARLARYDLLGDACRRLGIDSLLLGHNEDDQAETVYMRREKNSGWRGLAGMKEHAISPIWPQLYGITIVRPLLGVTRTALRDYNEKNNLSYIDDPSNENRVFTRIQARDILAKKPEMKKELLENAAASRKRLRTEKVEISSLISKHVEIYEWGGARLSKQILDNQLVPEVLKYLGLAVSGSAMPPSAEKLEALTKQLRSRGFKGATLGGARFVREENSILIVRDPGMVLGRAEKSKLEPLALNADTPTVWDGRFLVEPTKDDISAVPLMSIYDQLSKKDKTALKAIPRQALAGMPAFESGGKLMFANSTGLTTKCVIAERLSALLG